MPPIESFLTAGGAQAILAKFIAFTAVNFFLSLFQQMKLKKQEMHAVSMAVK